MPRHPQGPHRYCEKIKPRKPMTQKQYRALHYGHWFDMSKGFKNQGGQCKCGLTKAAYTTKLCMGYKVPQCTKSSTLKQKK